MESELYQSLVKEVEARSEAKGEVKCMRETIIRILLRRIGALDMAIREKIRGLSDIELLDVWYKEALGVIDAERARRLVDIIQKAPREQTSGERPLTHPDATRGSATRPNDLVRQLDETGRPVLLTRHGKSVAVLLSLKSFEDLEAAAAKLRLLSALREAERAVDGGSLIAREEMDALLASWESDGPCRWDPARM